MCPMSGLWPLIDLTHVSTLKYKYLKRGTTLNLTDIKSVVLDLRRSGTIYLKKLSLVEEEFIWATDGNYNQPLLPKFVCIYWAFETRKQSQG